MFEGGVLFFSTAGIEVAFWISLLVAFVVSFFTSMGGVSGAFLLLAFQMSFRGHTNPSALAREIAEQGEAESCIKDIIGLPRLSRGL